MQGGLVIDKGFYVDNFVGTYDIAIDSISGEKYIVSEERRYPTDKEMPLKKKRLFEYDAKTEDYIYMNFANINLRSEKSILGFCNQYGLPYSSQIIRDKNKWLGDDIDPSITEGHSDIDEWKYARNDVMTLNGFFRSVITVQKLMRLKILTEEVVRPLDSEGQNKLYTELIELLIFFLFFSVQYDFKFDFANEQKTIPKQRSLRFQYEFGAFRHEYESSIKENIKAEINQLPNIEVNLFLNYCEYLRSKKSKLLTPIFLQADLYSDTFGRILSILPGILYEDGNPLSHKHTFLYTSFGEVKFEESLLCESIETLTKLQQLGIEVFCGVINDGLGYATPNLIVEDGKLRGGWKFSYLISGIYMEILLETAMNSQFRKCANPTCGRYFSVSRSRNNKKYCCHECAVLVAKRRERKRKRNEGSTV